MLDEIGLVILKPLVRGVQEEEGHEDGEES